MRRACCCTSPAGSPLVPQRRLNLPVEMLQPSLTLTSKDNSFASLDLEVISTQPISFGEAQLVRVCH